MLCSRHSRVARNGAVLAQYASGFLACLLTCFMVASITVLLADVCTDYDTACTILCALDACFLYVSITITCLIAETIQIVLAFNRPIALYLLLLHALVLTTTCAELDKLMSVDGAGATLSMVVLGIRPLIHHYLRLFG